MDRAGSPNHTSDASVVPSAAYDEKPQSDASSDSIQSRAIDEERNAKQEKDLQAVGGEGDEGDEGDEKRDVERVVSKQPSVHNTSSIPDGGLWAWLQVLGAFVLFFNSW